MYGLSTPSVVSHVHAITAVSAQAHLSLKIRFILVQVQKTTFRTVCLVEPQKD